MPHTLSRNLVHCVFSTKGRLNLIPDPEALWKRLSLIARAKDISLVTAGESRPLADCSFSSNDLGERNSKSQGPLFAWQEGYGAFGVSESQRQTVLDDIAKQFEHHRKWTYEQEFLTLVCKSGVEYDPRHLFG